MSYTIKSFIASDGERYSLLFDKDNGGFPLFYPTAFISRTVRLKSTASTQKVYLEAIKRVCEWEAKEKDNLVIRFQKREFLNAHEIDSMAAHLRTARNGKVGTTISSPKANTYIAYASKYLRWLANTVITGANTMEVRTALDAQEKAFGGTTISKSGSASAGIQQILSKKLPEKTRDCLLALFSSPFPLLYRSADKGSRLRNIVMLRILYETGMRRGELLSLKLRNFGESVGGPYASLIIERNHHDEFDTRVNQSVAKTEGRIVVISDAAERQLLEYIGEYRSAVNGVGFSAEDFIFVNHRAGRGQGAALSTSTFDQALQMLKRTFPDLEPIYSHLLRHDWNYRFSTLVDIQGLKPDKERELREILMGWTEGSQMARNYNQRHTQEESIAYGLMVANDTKRTDSSRNKVYSTEAVVLALQAVKIR